MQRSYKTHLFTGSVRVFSCRPSFFIFDGSKAHFTSIG
nr:MAG TPA: hypothetical protein [Caudoviricetes sp.]